VEVLGERAQAAFGCGVGAHERKVGRATSHSTGSGAPEAGVSRIHAPSRSPT
jgi:hypothetical protein